MSNKIWYDYNQDDDLSKPSKVQATSSFISCNVLCKSKQLNFLHTEKVFYSHVVQANFVSRL